MDLFERLLRTGLPLLFVAAVTILGALLVLVRANDPEQDRLAGVLLGAGLLVGGTWLAVEIARIALKHGCPDRDDPDDSDTQDPDE